MLSFKVTYAIQILDLLHRNKEGILISDIHSSFPYLPSRTIVSDTVRLMEKGGVIRKISERNRRLRIAVPLSDLTLYDLSQVMDGGIGLGKSVGFNRWYFGYLETHPHIAETEQRLEDSIASEMRTITVAGLIDDTMNIRPTPIQP